VFMVLVGVLVGGLTYKFGLVLRESLVAAWRQEWVAGRGGGE